MLEFDLPTDDTVATTAWFPAAVEPIVHVNDVDDETLTLVHGIPPTETLVCPLTKFVPETVNDWPDVPDVGLIDVIVGVAAVLNTNDEVGNVMPFETTEIVDVEGFDPLAGTVHWTWPGVVWTIGHALEPIVTWILFAERANPLPLMVRRTPP